MNTKEKVEQWYQECQANFELDLTSPSALRWKINKGKMKAGDVAGTPTPQGYWKVILNGRSYIAHHIVAALADVEGWRKMREELEAHPNSMRYVIDHELEDKFNDPKALRVVSQEENTRNTYKHKQGKLLGVSQISPTTYRSFIQLNKVTTHLGNFNTAQEAHNAYKVATTMASVGFPVEDIKKTCTTYSKLTR